MNIPGPSSLAGMRDRRAQVGGLLRSDGSAFLSHGLTTVWCSVQGPGDCRLQKQNIEECIIDAHFKFADASPENEHRSLGGEIQPLVLNIAKKVILTKKFPKAEIAISLQELHNDGSLLACCVNALNLALLDAGVPMRYVVAGMNVALTDTGEVILDPTLSEEKSAKAVLTLVYESVERKLVMCSSTKGTYSLDNLRVCQNAVEQYLSEMFAFYRDVIAEKYFRLLPFE